MVAFAIDGGAEARRRGLDVVGTAAAAIAAAVGGGTLRDVLLGRHPVAWLTDPVQPAVILGIAFALCLLPVARAEWLARNSVLMVLDALGLGMATAVGTAAALQAGLPVMGVLAVGVMSGTCGGILRDLLVNQVPRIFRRSPPYATCAAVGVVVYLLVGAPAWSLPACVVAVAGVRIVTVLRDWHLPI